jgi:hypothetical protein
VFGFGFIGFNSLSTLAAWTSQQSAPATLQISGVLRDSTGKPLTGVVGVLLGLYAEKGSLIPVWLETQNVTADDSGRFTAALGATNVDDASSAR